MVISPCKKVCNLDSNRNYCLTCLRTIFEITNWSKFNEKEKEKVVKDLKKRIL